VCRCEVFVVADGNERLCALAQGTIVKLGDAPPH
jgi:acyl-coenzyme A thioesterase PaaI-like protein